MVETIILQKNLVGNTLSIAKRDKKILRLQNQAKLRSYRTYPKHKFGYQIPQNNYYENSLSIDKHNGNKKWNEDIKLKIDQQHECNNCKLIGKGLPSKGYKKIPAHLVFDAKHDWRHKARLVSDVNLTNVPLSSVH